MLGRRLPVDGEDFVALPADEASAPKFRASRPRNPATARAAAAGASAPGCWRLGCRRNVPGGGPWQGVALAPSRVSLPEFTVSAAGNYCAPSRRYLVGATPVLIMIWTAPVWSSAPSVHRPGGGAEAGAYIA